MTRKSPLPVLLILAGCAAQAPAPVSERSVVQATAPAARTAPLPAPNEASNKAPPLVVASPIGGEKPIVKPLGAESPQAAPRGEEAVPLLTEPKAVRLPYSERAKKQLKVAPASGDEKPAAKREVKPAEDGVAWTWPAAGKPKVLFTETTKGIDIAGTRGQPVRAAAAGKVIHVGDGLRGYGKLVIIRHTPMFLSAYAHNQAILVREGQRVEKGQQIAEMGDTGADYVKLHFEIRRFGTPVDPLKYLPGGDFEHVQPGRG